MKSNVDWSWDFGCWVESHCVGWLFISLPDIQRKHLYLEESSVHASIEESTSCINAQLWLALFVRKWLSNEHFAPEGDRLEHPGEKHSRRSLPLALLMLPMKQRSCISRGGTMTLGNVPSQSKPSHHPEWLSIPVWFNWCVFHSFFFFPFFSLESRQ